MIVSIQQFDDYSGNYEDSENAIATKEMCLRSAENVVKDYLRYDPEEKTYTEHISGRPVKALQLPVRNARNITSITIDDEVQTVSNFIIKDDCLRFADYKTYFWEGDENIVISFTGGWSDKDMPDLIRETVLRIATLMLMEAGENIGVSSKSMPDTSRTFVSYTNYNKYLLPLANLRVMVF